MGIHVSLQSFVRYPQEMTKHRGYPRRQLLPAEITLASKADQATTQQTQNVQITFLERLNVVATFYKRYQRSINVIATFVLAGLRYIYVLYPYSEKRLYFKK